MRALEELSKYAKIFCLIHKMDLVPEKERDIEFKKREMQIKKITEIFDIQCFRTSIWD